MLALGECVPNETFNPNVTSLLSWTVQFAKLFSNLFTPINSTLCEIWYHLHNFKNITNTHGTALLLLKLVQALKKCFHSSKAGSGTAQKMKFSIKDFFSKCDQSRGFLWIWSHLLKKSLMENFTFVPRCTFYCEDTILLSWHRSILSHLQKVYLLAPRPELITP